jgi:hypothetical protein
MYVLKQGVVPGRRLLAFHPDLRLQPGDVRAQGQPLGLPLAAFGREPDSVLVALSPDAGVVVFELVPSPGHCNN